VRTPRFPVSPLPYTVTDLGWFWPGAINNKGEIAGIVINSSWSSTYLYLWAKGKLRNLGNLVGNARVYGMNDLGQIVGTGLPHPGADESLSSFLFDSSQILPIPTNGLYSYGINNRGQIVGSGQKMVPGPYGPVYLEHGFLYTPGRPTVDLTFPGAGEYSESDAYGINNLGQVVGYSAAAGGKFSAYLFSNGRMQPIGDFYPSHINDHGQIAGTLYPPRTSRFGPPPGPHLCLYAAGHLMDLGALPHTTAIEVSGINNTGEIAGYYRINQSEFGTPFVCKGGQMHTITANAPPGWFLTQIYGINDAGQIIGLMNPPNQHIRAHGVLLTPKSPNR
jgi:probable HAF family extracellular repeat protein